MTIVLAGAAIVMIASAAGAQAVDVVVPLGTPVTLETTAALSSKSAVKGDMVPLRVVADVVVDGKIVIRRGAGAVGQIVDARAKGAMGMSGRLLLRPLYTMAGSRTVRLSGKASDQASVTAGAVLGTIALGVPFFTGRSAEIAAGARVEAMVEKTISLPALD